MRARATAVVAVFTAVFLAKMGSVWSAPTRDPPPKEPLVGGWVDAAGGLGMLHLRTLAVDEAAQRIAFVSTSEKGPVFNAGAGLRLSVVHVGPRFQILRTDRLDLWSIGGEVGVRVPIAIVVPHASIAAGRVATSRIRDEDSVAHGIAPASGYYARLGGGLALRLGRYVELDALATWELFALGPNGPTTGDLEQAVGALKKGGLGQVWAMGHDLGGIGYGTQLSLLGSARLRF